MGNSQSQFGNLKFQIRWDLLVGGSLDLGAWSSDFGPGRVRQSQSRLVKPVCGWRKGNIRAARQRPPYQDGIAIVPWMGFRRHTETSLKFPPPRQPVRPSQTKFRSVTRGHEIEPTLGLKGCPTTPDRELFAGPRRVKPARQTRANAPGMGRIDLRPRRLGLAVARHLLPCIN